MLTKQTEVSQAERENPIGHWVLSDNTDDVVWFTKHRAMPRRAAALVRICDLIRLNRHHHWVISYIPTKANLLADLLSRSYVWKDGRWVDKPAIMAEFFVACKALGYDSPVEVDYPDSALELLLPEKFKQTSADQWTKVIADLERARTERQQTKTDDSTESLTELAKPQNCRLSSQLSTPKRSGVTALEVPFEELWDCSMLPRVTTTTSKLSSR